MVKTFGVSNFKRNAHANTLENAFFNEKSKLFPISSKTTFF